MAASDLALGQSFASGEISNLNDDFVKLVGYTIVCLRYEDEHVVEGGTGFLIVTERMSSEAFIAYAIAKYFSSESYRNLTPEEKARFDVRYLDVHYTVAKRWKRRDPEFDERTLTELEGIRDRVARSLPGPRMMRGE